MASPIFQMRLAQVERDRWAEAAAAQGYRTLAEFVKAMVEAGIEAERGVEHATLEPVSQFPRPEMQEIGAAPKPRVVTTRAGVPPEVLGGKVFRGPDPKGGKTKK